jgi:hypothetical protein
MDSTKKPIFCAAKPVCSGVFRGRYGEARAQVMHMRARVGKWGDRNKVWKTILVQPSVAVLFARSDSIYKQLPDTDVWDIERDARNWHGGAPVVAHPPCRAWGRLRQFAKPRKGERRLATWSVRQVRQWGGVLEHPAASLLWPKAGLPAPGQRDKYGGWTLPINQHWWGHRAEKATLLYIVGCEPRDIPPIPYRMDEPTHVVQSRKRDSRPHISKAEREHTPPELAKWLVELAKRCAHQFPHGKPDSR